MDGLQFDDDRKEFKPSDETKVELSAQEVDTLDHLERLAYRLRKLFYPSLIAAFAAGGAVGHFATSGQDRFFEIVRMPDTAEVVYHVDTKQSVSPDAVHAAIEGWLAALYRQTTDMNANLDMRKRVVERLYGAASLKRATMRAFQEALERPAVDEVLITERMIHPILLAKGNDDWQWQVKIDVVVRKGGKEWSETKNVLVNTIVEKPNRHNRTGVWFKSLPVEID